MSTRNDPVIEIHPGLVMKGQLNMLKDVVLTGKFEGELQTQGKLTVSEGGTAVGTIEANALVLEPGNQVEARVKIGLGTRPKSASSPRPPSESKWPLRFKKLKEFALGLR
jgi:hypothetical protein